MPNTKLKSISEINVNDVRNNINTHCEGRLIKRDFFHKLYENVRGKISSVIIGPRQVGKTTAINTILSEILSNEIIDDEETSGKLIAKVTSISDSINSKVLYIRADDYIFEKWYKENGYEAISNYIRDNKVKYLVIDEIQVLEDWTRILKTLKDSFGSLIIMATGSDAERLSSLYESGTGRFDIIWAYHLSFIDFLELNGFNHKLLENSVDDKYKRAQEFLNDYITFGAFPENFNSRIRSRQLSVERVVEHISSEKFKDSRKIKALIDYIYSNPGMEISYEQVGSRIAGGIDKNTVKSYFDLLEKAMIIKQVSSIRLKKPQRKCYVINHTSLFNFTPEDFNSINSTMAGVAVENLVFTVLSQKFNVFKDDNVIHFADSSYRIGDFTGEIDFIIPSEKIAVEVKYRNDPRIDAKNSLRGFDGRKIVITKDYSGQYDGIEYIPLIKFLMEGI